MMDFLVAVNDKVNSFVWGVPIIVLILFVGLLYSFRLHFVHFRKAGFFVRSTVISAFKKKDVEHVPGELTSFQAAMVSVSAIVGSGNIAGVATALVLGGPGALVWMILAALIGMPSKYAEIALGIKYREKREDGTVVGGAMYYLEKGLGQKWMGVLMSILVIPFAFVISGIVDTNTIAAVVDERIGIPTWATGAFLALVCAIIIFGGIRRIGYACELISPFMGGAYILAGILIIIFHITEIPAAIVTIFSSAFSPQAATGGIVGSVFVCMRAGIARGLYSNEAGLGTAAMVHSSAKVEHPIEQAMWGPVEVFLDTIVICTITSLAIVLSGLWNSGLDGAVLTMRAFEVLLPGSIGGIICFGCVILFGFSCLISYYNYAERAGEYLFGSKCKPVIKVLWIITIFIGSQTTLGFAWDLADTFNGLMIIPNLIGLILLSGEVVSLTKEYFGLEESGSAVVESES